MVQAGGQLLFEVPGWPDAPRPVRLRRALPILLPCAAVILLVAWSHLIRNPQIASVRASHQDLHVLEAEIADLRESCSDQQAAELAARSAQAKQLLVDGPQKLEPVLQSLKIWAAKRGWDATFQPGDAAAVTPSPEAQILYLPVRGRLTPAATGTGAFSALLALLEQFSTTEKRIDLTRLAVRADEQGRYAVELNLRLACLIPHEKSP